MEVAVGTVVAGKYELEKPLARGGMGSVWVARHVKLGARLAVKFLDPRFASSTAFIDRFEREARSAATLQSPHVVHVQDYGVEGDTPYLVMELLQGEDLGQRLHRERRLSLPDTARILLQVGKALRKAHDAGIVHRDLKPANLFITRGDEEEIVKVLDFGIAKETASPLGDQTRTGELMGSPHYMCPEQAKADKGIDHRADLWSIGVILYRTVTGALPFPGDVLGAVLSKILVEPVPLVASIAPDLPPSLDPFFAKAMAKNKEQRFQSIREMVDAFVGIAGGVPMSASGHVRFDTSGTHPAAAGPGGTISITGAGGSITGAGGSITGAGAGSISNPAMSGSGAFGSGPHGGSGPLAGSGAFGSGPYANAGPSTLTNANSAAEASLKPKRSAAPWIAVAVVVALAAGGGAFGWSRMQSATGGSPAASPTTAPDESKPQPPSSSSAAQPTASADAPAPPSSAPAAPGSAAAAPSTAPTSAPVASTPAPPKPAAPTRPPTPTKPADKKPPKGTPSSSGWGF